MLRAAADGGDGRRSPPGCTAREGTVRNYLSSAMGKTGARTRAEAVLIAEQRGWL